MCSQSTLLKSGCEPSSPNCESSAGVKARHLLFAISLLDNHTFLKAMKSLQTVPAESAIALKHMLHVMQALHKPVASVSNEVRRAVQLEACNRLVSRENTRLSKDFSLRMP